MDVCDAPWAEVDDPLRYSTRGVRVCEYVLQRRLGDDNYRVLHEVMAQLVGCSLDGICQLLVMRVPLLSWCEDLAEVVDRALDAMDFSCFVPFDDEQGTYHLRGGCDV